MADVDPASHTSFFDFTSTAVIADEAGSGTFASAHAVPVQRRTALRPPAAGSTPATE